MKLYVLGTFLLAFLLPILAFPNENDRALNYLEKTNIQQVFVVPAQESLKDFGDSASSKRRYDGYALLRFSDPLVTIPLLETLSDYSIDVWKYGPDHTDVLVQPAVLSKLNENPSIKFEVLISNVQRHLQWEEENLKMVLSEDPSDPNSWFKSYHRFDAIVKWFENLSKDYPDLVEFIPSIGKTHEERDIIAVRITNRNSNVDNKKQYWIQANQHAREWIGGAVAQYTAQQLVNLFKKDEGITSLLNNGEFIIVPCSNPDGYEYTWVKDRLWRKNRRLNNRSSYGVDLNRNWDANWGHGGSSKFPFSETYQGPKVNSEPEVQALSSFFLENPRIIAAIDLHSYSQLILRPLGWTKKPPAHEKEHKQVCDEMAAIIEKVNGKTYVSEPSIALYPTTGSASDWFYLQKRKDENCGLDHFAPFKHEQCRVFRAYGITIELRPTPEWWGPGFVLPPEEIIPTGEEVFPALIHYFSFATTNILWDQDQDD